MTVITNYKWFECAPSKSNSGNLYTSTASTLAPIKKESPDGNKRSLGFGCTTQINSLLNSLVIKGTPPYDQPLEKILKQLHAHLNDLAHALKRIIEIDFSEKDKDLNTTKDGIGLF